MRRLVPPAILAAALLGLVAAGCGGTSSETKANEAYADSVCTAVGAWQKQMKSIVTNFSGSVSKSVLETKITQAESATKNLVTQVKSVPPPDTSEGQAAKQQVNQLSTEVTNTVDTAKSAVAQISGDASAATIASAVAALAPQVQNLANQAKSTLSSLQSVGGSLESAFKNTDSCQSLG